MQTPRRKPRGSDKWWRVRNLPGVGLQSRLRAVGDIGAWRLPWNHLYPHQRPLFVRKCRSNRSSPFVAAWCLAFCLRRPGLLLMLITLRLKHFGPFLANDEGELQTEKTCFSSMDGWWSLLVSSLTVSSPNVCLDVCSVALKCCRRVGQPAGYIGDRLASPQRLGSPLGTLSSGGKPL